MRVVFESGFYYIYLVFIIGAGVLFTLKNKTNKGFILLGLACLLLGLGDAFHLIPRAIGLYNGTLDNPDATLSMYLGIGKLVTSVTMTLFYLLFYFFIYKRIDKKRNIYLDIVVYLLVIARIVLVAMPQNDWLHNGSDLLWGGLRNIPFTLLGILIIVLSIIHLRNIKAYKLLFLAIILSFIFYLLVVFLAGTYPLIGLMMLPKTICYMWIAVMIFMDFKSVNIAAETE